jgi:hypothetical protein
MGIANKCYELLEARKDYDSRNEPRLGLNNEAQGSEDDGEDEDDEEEGDDDDEQGQDDETESDDDDDDADTDSDTGSEDSETRKGGAARLRLREILFYDDKVAIFKARHGRL